MVIGHSILFAEAERTPQMDGGVSHPHAPVAVRRRPTSLGVDHPGSSVRCRRGFRHPDHSRGPGRSGSTRKRGPAGRRLDRLGVAVGRHAVRTRPARPNSPCSYPITGPPSPVRVFDFGPVMVLPLVTRGQVRGVIALSRSADRRAFTATDLELATEFAHQATFALELVQSRADQLRLSVLEAQDRIARDLHDHVIQALFATGMGLESIINRIDPPDLRHRLANHVDALDDVITQIRATIYQIQLPGGDHTAIKARILTLIDEHAEALGFLSRRAIPRSAQCHHRFRPGRRPARGAPGSHVQLQQARAGHPDVHRSHLRQR